MDKLSHLNDEGSVQMVDVTAKASTPRQAVAQGRVQMKKATLELLEEGRMAKGNVLTAAKIAGIMAAKKTGEIIPLCIRWASPPSIWTFISSTKSPG